MFCSWIFRCFWFLGVIFLMDAFVRFVNYLFVRERMGIREENEILFSDYLNGVKLEMDGYFNKDFY